jgi:signal transduction histidine kinase
MRHLSMTEESEVSRSIEAILAADDEAAVAAAVAELDAGAHVDAIRQLALEQIELRARLASSNRAREVLLASISHDLRNPLNTFAMSAGLLRDDVERGEIERSRDIGLIQRMERAIEKMQRLIEDLGEASRLEARRVELTRRPEPLARLVADAVAGATAIAAERSANLTVEPIAEPGSAHADRARIIQIFGKLVSYCVRVIGDGGTIAVSAGRTNDAMTVTMVATPAGNTPLPPVEEGRGSLALLLARAVIELHGGALTIDHTAIMTIRFTLPIA